MNQGIKHIVAVLFMVLFCVYAVSPLHYAELTDVEVTFSLDRTDYLQTSPRLLLLQVVLWHLFGTPEKADASPSVGALTKKRNAVVSSQVQFSVRPTEKTLLHTCITVEDLRGAVSIAPYEAPAHALKGFHLLVSGLSPPC